MRTESGFNAAAVAVPAAVAGGGRSGSDAAPLLYLFGGLVAMLGLVGVALILLACAYWKLSGHFDRGGAERGANLEPAMATPATFYKQEIVVVMAGDEKPTYLATPIPAGASSFDEKREE
ncbi:protein GLUTAMINE DUMPER 3-like [Musa acuminata AAA Group]|uniref:protein GLUTAMINE DUMPER 3-like n=1 Tax=Musa acuminata AAA Group TaxID=214697 RepID=UPI0031D7DDFF